jgi:hypothetical protein
MKQLYAAGPLHRESQNTDLTSTPAPGRRLSLPQICGSSSGLLQHELQSALPATFYSAPPQQNPERALPIRLALLNTPAGRVLAHVTPSQNGFFAHTLLDVPETADAQLAIQTWGSPLWQRNDPQARGELPEMPYLPVADLLDDSSLRSWVQNPDHARMLEFALTAMLTTPASQRIILAAPADDVAMVVYAITRVLPAGLLEQFTFSTFEADPLACTARLIGHDVGSEDAEIPEACYSSQGVAWNAVTGKRSDLKDVAFAPFAVESLASGQLQALDEIKATWQRLGLKDAEQFILVDRLSRGTGLLTKDEAIEALRHAPLAAWIATQPQALDQLLNWALDDRAFANTSFCRAAQNLRQKSDTLGRLATKVREQGLLALKEGDHNRTANALEVVLPMVAPTRANAVWGELLAGITDPAELPWEMRWYLLPRFVRFKLQQNPSEDGEKLFARWLDVPAERLGELLALDLPRSYQLAACQACLAQPSEPSQVLVTTLSRHVPLTLTLLQDAQQGTALFEALLRDAPALPWFQEVVERAPDYAPELLNRYFEAALTAGRIDADRLVRTQGTRILELFAGRSGLDHLGKLFLAEPPVDLLNNLSLIAFLRQLRTETVLTPELTRRIDGVLAVREYLDSPTFHTAAMAPVAAGLELTPPALPGTARGELFSALATGLEKRAHADTVQHDLEATLIGFGGTLAQDSTDLYENLLRELRSNTELARHPKLLEAFLAVALGATVTPELSGKLDGLDGHAFAVASDAAKRGGNRLLNHLDSAARDWPKESRVKWNFLLAAVRPQGWQRICRDAGFFAAGLAIASLGWWIARQLS